MKFWHIKLGREVDVIKFVENSSGTGIKALIWDSIQADKTHQSNGWVYCKLNALIPLDYYYSHKEYYLSDEERKELKRIVKYEQSTWTTTDGEVFTDCDKALLYERSLIKSKIRYLLSKDVNI